MTSIVNDRQLNMARVVHISISGDLGSGKSAVAQAVADELQFRLVSTGDVQRSLAQEMEMSTLEANIVAETDRRIDQKVDGVTTRLGKESTEPIVFDSRMAWKMVEHSLKVRLVVDPEVAAQRAFSRSAAAEEYSTLQEARAMLHERFESEARRFLARYGVDVTSTQHYDLIIDTSDATIHDVATVVIKTYRDWDAAGGRRIVVASPRRIIPLSPRITDAWPGSRGDGLPVVYSRPFFAALGHHPDLLESITTGDPFTPVNVLAQGQEEIEDGISAADFVGSRVTPDVTHAWELSTGLNFDSYWAWVAGA